MITNFAKHLRMRGRSTATIKRRTATLRAFERFVDPKPLTEATTNDIEDFLSTKPAPRTRHAYRSDMRVFYAWALDKGHVASDPACKIGSIKTPSGLPHPLTEEQAQRIMQRGSLRMRRMVALGLHAGLRCGEIAALNGSDLWMHIAEPELIVREGKGGKDRRVAMADALIELFDGVGPGAVFPNTHGQHISAQSVGAAIKLHMLKCGVDATAHQLRHTFGTELSRVSGGNVPLVQSEMGHANSNTTMNYVRSSLNARPYMNRMYGAVPG